MPAFSYLMPDHDSTARCTQEDLEKEWTSLWKRLGAVARSCPDVSSDSEKIDMWLDSWHAVMAELKELDSKTESTKLRPVKPSPLLEKLIVGIHKKCKVLEDPVVRGWAIPPPAAIQGGAAAMRKRGESESEFMTHNAYKGKESLNWLFCMDRSQAQVPKTESRSSTYMDFNFPTAPGPLLPSPPPMTPSPRPWTTRGPPLPPPFSHPPPLVVSVPYRSSPPTSRATSPTPASVVSDAPAHTLHPSPSQDWTDNDEEGIVTVASDSPHTSPLSSPIMIEPPPPVPLPSRSTSRYINPVTLMTGRELVQVIERRQCDIELAQHEISRKQSEISRAVADITGWIVELRHKQVGL